MKKNLALLGVLIALIVATYILQEKRVEHAFNEEKTRGRLVEEEIRSFEMEGLSAEKREGHWWSGKVLLSHNLLGLIEKKLSEIKTVKTIEGKPSDLLKDAKAIKINGVPWLIGGMNFDETAFYVSKNGKIHLAIMDSGSNITTEEDLEESKLKELLGLINRPPSSLKETQMFRFYPELPSDSVFIEADGSQGYELLLKENKTIPPPIEGISVQEQLAEKFKSVVTQITLKEELPYSEKLKHKRLANMTFKSADGKNVSWQIWMRARGSADAILIDDGTKRAFLMVGGTLRTFFLQVQDFWDKKVVPPKQFRAFERLPVAFTQGAKTISGVVIDKEPLDFEFKEARAKAGNMQDLFQLIFNLGPRDQADRVSQLTKSDRQHFLNADPLKIEVMEQELLCIRKKDELILANLSRGFKAHFLAPFENLNCRLQDVLE
jgi:hypothetical protein